MNFFADIIVVTFIYFIMYFQHNPGLPAARQRRIASSFRDHSLFQIFSISLTSLFQLKSDVGNKLQELSLMLSLSCLSFDFMGTSYDESSDEIGTVQVPSGWKPALEDSSTLQIFFDYYALNQVFSKEALECLLRLASIRRSLFPNDTARMKFLSHLMRGTKEILQTGIGLSDHDNYHGFCRLLGRFKLNYQLSELVNAEGYSEWIHLVAEFTLKSLHSWKFLVNLVPRQMDDHPSVFITGIDGVFELASYDVLWTNEPKRHFIHLTPDFTLRFWNLAIGSPLVMICTTCGPVVMCNKNAVIQRLLDEGSVASVRYLKGDKPNLLDEYVPKVIEGFVSSSIVHMALYVCIVHANYCNPPFTTAEQKPTESPSPDCLRSTHYLSLPRISFALSELSDELGENPLDNVEVLQDQLEFFPFLCRFQYESCSSYLMKIVEPIMKNYMVLLVEANLQSQVDSFELSVTESKLAWFTHIVAAILRTKQISGSSSGESHEILDAEISACVLQLINISDSGFHSKRYEDVSKQRLDRAILTFFQHFRKCYIGDQIVSSSKLYTRLSELLGLHDHLLLLNVIVGKMITNLKCYTKCKEVIDHTLNLFLEMTSGYMSGKLLLKLDSVKQMISNKNVLARLESTPDALFQSDAVKFAFIGLMRDLRGIAMATNSRRTYGFLFDWLYPVHMPLLLKGITHYADIPEVCFIFSF
ncbi:hypothetical protein V8G54_029765 [Vigna mungo]|uniref:Exportin-7/Ran-binding protein 17 TPR repeats domain-containing protein n=1 Tax=Vigna mungo TaxID=3915 RepID=A0AAQ3MTZ8_VIGMU